MLQRFIEELSQTRRTVGLEQVDEIFLKNGVMVFRKDKLIFSSRDGGHLTIWYDGTRNILEYHDTEEGAEKTHTVLSRYDLSRLTEDDQRRVEQACWRTVEPDDAELSKLRISIPREKKDFTGTLYRRVSRRRGVLDPAVEKDMEANFKNVDLRGFWESDANRGMVFREGQMAGLIFWTPLAVFYFDIGKHGRLMNDLMESARLL